MREISIIVAIASNYAIGKDNDLLWHISDDLKHFKKITSGHPVIMGKRTYESLPFKPLPGRDNVVLTDVIGEQISGCIMVYSIEEALKWCDGKGECFIIGGGSVYKQFMPFANKLYITFVEKDFEADTFFPTISNDEWELVLEEKNFSQENNFQYYFREYLRK